jgi:hypothetical protein
MRTREDWALQQIAMHRDSRRPLSSEERNGGGPLSPLEARIARSGGRAPPIFAIDIRTALAFQRERVVAEIVAALLANP